MARIRRGLFLLLVLMGVAPVLATTSSLLGHGNEASGATGSALTIGVAEDAPKQVDAAGAKRKMDLAKLAGFSAVQVTELWARGQTAPSSADVTALQNAANAARLDGLRLIVAIFNGRSSNTPVSDSDRGQFAQFAQGVANALPGVRDFVIGNEPNNNLFWLPQFNTDGSDAAAPAYEALLAQTYDAIKTVRPTARIMGGALAPRGGDNPSATKPTHSPTAFIKDLGAAYRASGRGTPIMDVFDLHVYQDTSSIPPSFDHLSSTTISVADYGKLVSLLAQAFDGTGQAGSSLPIFYGEFGVETIIPARKTSLYTGTEPSTTHPVDEPTQGSYYVQAMKVVYCQPNVIGLMLFHVSDEPNLAAWQSGVDYADDTAKASISTVRDGISAAASGGLTPCPDTIPPTVTLTAPGDGSTVKGAVSLAATAADSVGVNRVEFLVNGAVIGSDAVPPYTSMWNTGANGSYTLTARALDAVRTSACSSVTVTVSNPPTIGSFTPTSGLPGTSVKITGTNLTGATAVAFNGTAATFTVDSNTQITAIVPRGATTGPISVTTPAGSTTSTTSFTVQSVLVAASFSPTADATVKETSPASNFGTASTLEANGGKGARTASYLQFTVSGVANGQKVQSAVLRLYVASDATSDGPPLYSATAPWTETEITWSNRPAASATPTDDVGAISAGTWVEYRVTPLATGNGTYTFVLGPSLVNDGVVFGSREATTNQPQLVVTLG